VRCNCPYFALSKLYRIEHFSEMALGVVGLERRTTMAALKKLLLH
jgi:hypothetical protein